MGRAEDLFERISEQGEEAIDTLIADRQSEELFLDFIRSADNGSGSRLHDNDRWNLAKAISGFGNSEGGVIVWGIDCRRQPEIGDVASAKVPIHNPKRFLSWLEGAVSGCTVPTHPLVRHAPIEILFTGTGFVVTHVSKSYLAPHQCLKPLQYYIRAGSDFVPAPHAVLAGLFGRRPEPFVYHAWTMADAKIVPKAGSQKAVEFKLGFLLSSHGPGVARDLYVNVRIFPPNGPTEVSLLVSDQANWKGQHAFGVMTNLVSIDSFKLPPEAMTQPILFQFSFVPPFETDFLYEITFGHGQSPVRKIDVRIKPEVLQEAYDAFVNGQDGDTTGRTFIKTVMDLEKSGAIYGSEYE